MTFNPKISCATNSYEKEEIERNSSIYTREDVDFANQHGWVMGWEDCKEAVLEIINENLDTKPYNIIEKIKKL